MFGLISSTEWLILYNYISFVHRNRGRFRQANILKQLDIYDYEN